MLLKRGASAIDGAKHVAAQVRVVELSDGSALDALHVVRPERKCFFLVGIY